MIEETAKSASQLLSEKAKKKLDIFKLVKI